MTASSELAALKTAGKDIKPPSKYFHWFRILLALIGDIIDVVAVLVEIGGIATAGVASAIAVAIDAGIDIIVDIILFLTELTLDKHKKKLGTLHGLILQSIQVSQMRMQGYVATLERKQLEITATVQQYQEAQIKHASAQNQSVPESQRQQQFRDLLSGKRLQPGKAKAGQIRSQLIKISKSRIVVKMGWLRNLIQSLLDLVPIVELVPWRSVGILLRHRAYKKQYQQVMVDHQEAIQIKQDEISFEKEFEQAMKELDNEMDKLT